MNEQVTQPVQAQAPTQGARSVPAFFGRLRDEIDQVFDDFSFARPVRNVFQLPAGLDFSPVMDLEDRKDHYELAIELPGIEEKDITVEVSDGALSISGEKRAESETKSGDYLVSERSYGSFRRRLTLPGDVDPDGIEAKYRHGVLRLTLKKDKHAVSRIRKIAIR